MDPQEDEAEDEIVDDLAVSSGSSRRRLAPEEMDALKARMVREGYPLLDSSKQGNETIYKSLTRGVRREQVLALVGMTSQQFEPRLQELRRQHYQATGRT